MTSFSLDAVAEPTAHRSVAEPEVEALDRAPGVHDLELAAANMQSRGDVLVHEVGSEDDLLVEHVEQPVGADEPDELDLAAPWQLLGDAHVRIEQSRLEGQPRGVLVGRRSAERGIAVVGVVEVLEPPEPPREMTQVAEALAAEEALVECVIEVLDDPLAPGFPERHENWDHALGEAQPHRRRQGVRAVGDEPVVDLEPLWDAEAPPDPDERGRRRQIALPGLELAGRRAAANVDDVADIERDGPGKMTRADEVGLLDRVRPGSRGGRVRGALGGVAHSALAPGGPGALEDPLDRAQLRKLSQAQLLELPSDRRGADLGPGVGLQPPADPQHERLELRLSHLKYPTLGASERASNVGHRLVCQHPTHRLAAHPLFRIHLALPARSFSRARGSRTRDPGACTMCCRLPDRDD